MLHNLNTALWICDPESQSNALGHNTRIKNKYQEADDGREELSLSDLMTLS